MRPTTLPLILWLRCNSTPIRLRYDYDPTTTRLLPIRRKQKMNMSIFRRSRIVVVSLSNRTHIVISVTSVVVECVVVSSWYRLKGEIRMCFGYKFRLRSIALLTMKQLNVVWHSRTSRTLPHSKIVDEEQNKKLSYRIETGRQQCISLLSYFLSPQ